MKRMNIRLALSILWLLLGLTLIALTVADVLNDSVFSGMGGALTAIGALRCVQQHRFRKDPEYRRKIETEERDERNQFLSMKSWKIAGTATVIIMGTGSLIAAFTGHRTEQLMLAYSVCLLVAAYWISYLVLARKY